MESNIKRNTLGIEKFREEKKDNCNRRLEETVYEMLAEKEEINFNSLSKRAELSKKYLYDNHFDMIDALRKKNKKTGSKTKVTESGKDILLAAKDKRIKELEAEVSRLKEILKRKYGETYYRND